MSSLNQNDQKWRILALFFLENCAAYFTNFCSKHSLNTVKPPLIFIAMWSRFTGIINFLSFALVSACSFELTIHFVWLVKRHRRCRIDGSGNSTVKYHYSYCFTYSIDRRLASRPTFQSVLFFSRRRWIQPVRIQGLNRKIDNFEI